MLCTQQLMIICQRKLNRGFYTQPTLKVAKLLLGKYIVRKIGNKKLVGKIIETEVYIGPQDKASHAFLPRRDFRKTSIEDIKKVFGGSLLKDKAFLENLLRGGGKITPRNRAEYFVGGHIYIYLVYGMYWQMNISTSGEGKPECVLIRAVEPEEGEISLANGPGKFCRYLKLDESFYGEDLTKSKRIWLEDRGGKIKPSQILATKRIGIDYAGSYWSRRKLRFLIKDFKKYLPR